MVASVSFISCLAAFSAVCSFLTNNMCSYQIGLRLRKGDRRCQVSLWDQLVVLAVTVCLLLLPFRSLLQPGPSPPREEEGEDTQDWYSSFETIMEKNHSWKGRNCFLIPFLSSSLIRLSKSLFTDLWNMQSFSSPPWRKWSKNNLHAQWVFKRGLFQRPHSSFPRLREQQEQLWDDQCVPGNFPRPLIKYPHSFLPDILSCLMGVLMQSLFQLWDQGACFGTWTRTLWGRKEKGYTVHIRCRTISI